LGATARELAESLTARSVVSGFIDVPHLVDFLRGSRHSDDHPAFSGRSVHHKDRLALVRRKGLRHFFDLVADLERERLSRARSIFRGKDSDLLGGTIIGGH